MSIPTSPTASNRTLACSRFSYALDHSKQVQTTYLQLRHPVFAALIEATKSFILRFVGDLCTARKMGAKFELWIVRTSTNTAAARGETVRLKEFASTMNCLCLWEIFCTSSGQQVTSTLGREHRREKISHKHLNCLSLWEIFCTSYGSGLVEEARLQSNIAASCRCADQTRGTNLRLPTSSKCAAIVSSKCWNLAPISRDVGSTNNECQLKSSVRVKSMRSGLIQMERREERREKRRTRKEERGKKEGSSEE
eukprot:g66421.t1